MKFDSQPACAEHNIGIIPWGVSYWKIYEIVKHSKSEKNWKILDEVNVISKEIGRSLVQVTLNWTMQEPGITSP
ncbi:hypothetical protein RhiirB3_532910 [Rhizophagus irregularis]|nr:hypothetical protein RhiirB3_532910 [Rhizophagus irregularis]